MFTLKELVQPNSGEEAYRILTDNPANVVLGGCAFLRMGAAKYNVGIDLTQLGWDKIIEHNDGFEIGAMVTFRALETKRELQVWTGGILAKALGNVVGVQFRNIVTVGATVFTRYGFSDLITPLLALGAEVELVKGGRVPLKDFLERPAQKDILKAVWVPKKSCQASFQSFRISAADFPVLNAAVVERAGEWTVTVGGRPGRAMIAEQAVAILNSGPVKEQMISEAAKSVAGELVFEANMRAGAEYRRSLSEVLVCGAVREVLACA